MIIFLQGLIVTLGVMTFFSVLAGSAWLAEKLFPRSFGLYFVTGIGLAGLMFSSILGGLSLLVGK